MQSAPLTLAAGAHAVEVRAVTSYGVVDWLEVAPLSPRPITTWADWRAAHFAADQLADEATAGAAARPVDDAFANLLKYALGLDPWTRLTESGIRAVTAGGQSRFTYARPAGLSDVAYVVEGSDDGEAWAALPQTRLMRSDGADVMEAIGAARRYFRLRVTRGAEVATSETVSGDGTRLTATRLGNLSARAGVGAGAAVLIAGFNVAGTGSKSLCLRGVGPGLLPFGLMGALGDPRLELFRGTAKVAENDDWSADPGAAARLAGAGGRVGAFALVAGSRDAALLANLGAGGYSVQVAGAGGATGIALAEIYDADTDGFLSGTRLANLSARARVGLGGEMLVAGFSIVGLSGHLVLVRAVGPALARFGVEGVLADPKLEVFRGAAVLAANDNWSSQGEEGGATAVETAAGRAGAFALERTSRDAALLLLLSPGSYTAQVSGVGGTTGVALVEVYEVL